jgi:hypothetical protein
VLVSCQNYRVYSLLDCSRIALTLIICRARKSVFIGYVLKVKWEAKILQSLEKELCLNTFRSVGHPLTLGIEKLTDK